VSFLGFANFYKALANGVLITRLKTLSISHQFTIKGADYTVTPALKVCVTSALSKKDVEKAGVTIRHAVTKVMTRKTNNKLGVPAA
jgi:serine palmitoyltransferase